MNLIKTYSVCFLVKDTKNLNNGEPYWVINWYENKSLDDFDWDKIDEYSKNRGDLAYGYQYCENSNQDHPRCRTIIKDFRQ